jgi:cytoskeletal protein RodZ
VSARRLMVARLFVFCCALVLMAFAAGRAQADPTPEAPPQPHNGSAQLQPVPAPSTSGTSTSTSTQVNSSTTTRLGTSTSTHVSPPASTSIRSVSRRPVQRRTKPQAARHQLPSLNSGWPAWLRNAAALNELPPVGGSSSTRMLVAAGIALVLLVLAEASFLGLAGSRLGRADVRPDEPLAIRRVELRR